MSGESVSRAEETGVDRNDLLREIDAEVLGRRRTGEVSTELDRELAAAFDRFAPELHDVGVLMERAEELMVIDADAPVASSRPGLPLVKRAVQRSTAWSLRHITEQVTMFASAMVQVSRALTERLERLEALTPGADLGDGGIGTSECDDPIVAMHAAALEEVAEVTGRVMQAEVSDGMLLRALLAAGLDAYGTDSRPALAAARVQEGLDVWAESALCHLRSVGGSTLGAVVLAGCVDRMPRAALVELADVGTRALVPGGRFVVLTTSTTSWGRGVTAVEADLASGRPLRPATWEYLLAERGFERCATRPGPTPRIGRTDDVSVVAGEVVGPASFLVSGMRPAR